MSANDSSIRLEVCVLVHVNAYYVQSIIFKLSVNCSVTKLYTIILKVSMNSTR